MGVVPTSAFLAILTAPAAGGCTATTALLGVIVGAAAATACGTGTVVGAAERACQTPVQLTRTASQIVPALVPLMQMARAHVLL